MYFISPISDMPNVLLMIYLLSVYLILISSVIRVNNVPVLVASKHGINTTHN